MRRLERGEVNSLKRSNLLGGERPNLGARQRLDLRRTQGNDVIGPERENLRRTECGHLNGTKRSHVLGGERVDLRG